MPPARASRDNVVTDGAIDLAHLRERLKASLPDHMVPALTALDALPLTANGKLDHTALPAPGATADISAPPEGADEMALAGIWAEVLGVPRIGRDDNFFAWAAIPSRPHRSVSKCAPGSAWTCRCAGCSNARPCAALRR